MDEEKIEKVLKTFWPQQKSNIKKKSKSLEQKKIKYKKSSGILVCETF